MTILSIFNHPNVFPNLYDSFICGTQQGKFWRNELVCCLMSILIALIEYLIL